MSIKITADSTCDLSPALLDRYGITLMPLYVLRDGQTFRDGVDIHPEDIFAHVDAGGALCKTAAPNPEDFHVLFAQFAGDHDAVIHITIGAEFSSSYQNACIAASEFDNVYVVDSRNLSTGQGHVVIEAAKLAKAGASADEIVRAMQELAPRVDASFLIDRLDYLYKGGRCSAVAALGANLLHLRPCIEVRNGKMGVAKKYRGPFAKCIAAYAKERLTAAGDIVQERVFITHTPCTDETIQAARDAVAQNAHFSEVYETTAGCTVSCHCGPSTLGVLYIHENAI
jgi:DegV family protein with EDD domain